MTVTYDCYEEDFSRASTDHVGEFKFAYGFHVDPSVGDTIEIGSSVWKISRRHWKASGESILIIVDTAVRVFPA